MTDHLTEALFREVVGQFDWPGPWKIENDLPDGMILQLPRCGLYFAQGYGGNVTLEFMTEDTGADARLGLVHAIQAAPPLTEDARAALEAQLFGDDDPLGSETKVRHGLSDICVVLLARLSHVLEGDFGWAQQFR